MKTYVAPRPARQRPGMTLVELLVVILIMLMITALTIPMIAPALSGRQVREAARAIDVFVNGARSRAMQSDLGFGVMIQRDANSPQMSTTLVYCEQPPNYAGDYQNSKMLMLGNGGFGAWQTYMPATGTFVVDSSPVFPQSDIGWINNVGPGDTFFLHDSNLTLYRLYSGEPYIDVNGNGTFDPGEPFNDVDGSGVSAGGLPAGVGYTPPTLPLDPMTGCFYLSAIPPFTPVVWGTPKPIITYSFADPLLAAQCMSSTGLSPLSALPFWVDTNPSVSTSAALPSGWSTDLGVPLVPGAPGTSTGLAFQFERRPVISAAPPLELPEGTCIDLGGTWLDPTSGVQVPIIGSGMDVPASMLTSGGAGTLVSMATFR
ncbi:MAG: pilus assembly FimT family protein, partial [Pirellulales bacterium]